MLSLSSIFVFTGPVSFPSSVLHHTFPVRKHGALPEILAWHFLDHPKHFHLFNLYLIQGYASYSSRCSTRLRVSYHIKTASKTEGAAVPLFPVHRHSFRGSRKDDRPSQLHLVLIQLTTGARTQDPKIRNQPPEQLSHHQASRICK